MQKHMEMIVKEGLFIKLFPKKGLDALEKDDIYNISNAPSETVETVVNLYFSFFGDWSGLLVAM